MLDGSEGEAVAFRGAVRHVGIDRDPELAQGLREDRETGQAIGVEVSEDHDGLAGCLGGFHALHEQSGIRQEPWIVQTPLWLIEQGREHDAVHRAAPGQDAQGPRREAARASVIDRGA